MKEMINELVNEGNQKDSAITKASKVIELLRSDVFNYLYI